MRLENEIRKCILRNRVGWVALFKIYKLGGLRKSQNIFLKPKLNLLSFAFSIEPIDKVKLKKEIKMKKQ